MKVKQSFGKTVFEGILDCCNNIFSLVARRLTQEIDLETGVVVRETYRLNRFRHRDPAQGPADVWRDAATGIVENEEYRSMGQLHRIDGPAEVGREVPSGIVHRERYWRYGRLHRDPKEGPAERLWEPATGVIFQESYYVNGEPWRDPADGPWYIQRNMETGVVEHADYSSRPENARADRATGSLSRRVRKKPSP